MKVSVVIPTFKRINKLDRCIKSLENQTYPYIDIYIYCDGGDKETFDYIAQKYQSKYYSILSDKHRYVTGSWNNFLLLAYKEGFFSESSYVLFAVDDVELEPNCISNAVSKMIKEFPDTDGVVGIHQICPGHPQYTYCPVGQCLVGSKFIERYKDVDYKLCCPDYTHFQMGEFYKYVQHTGKFILAKEAILKHYHPSFITNEVDETHDLLRTDIRKRDAETAKKRQEKNLVWGKSWELIN